MKAHVGAFASGLREGAALVRGYLAADSQQSEPKVRKLWKKFAPMHPPHQAFAAPALPSPFAWTRMLSGGRLAAPQLSWRAAR